MSEAAATTPGDLLLLIVLGQAGANHEGVILLLTLHVTLELAFDFGVDVLQEGLLCEVVIKVVRKQSPAALDVPGPHHLISISSVLLQTNPVA